MLSVPGTLVTIMAILLHCFLSVIKSLSSASFIPVIRPGDSRLPLSLFPSSCCVALRPGSLTICDYRFICISYQFMMVFLACWQGWFAIAFPWFCLPCPFVLLPNKGRILTVCTTRGLGFINPSRIWVGRDGALVESIAFNRRVVGSTPALAVT